MRISVFNSRELQAVLLGLRSFDRDLRKQVRQQTKAVAQPEWQKAVLKRASTALEIKVLARTARAQVSDQNVMLQSAGSVKKLSGGLKPSVNFAAVEFGADTRAKTTYRATSKKGTSYSVTRRTKAQFKPRNRKGYVVFPAAAEMIPRLAALWVQTFVRTFYESLEKK